MPHPSKSAWAIMVYGLPTLALRLKRQQHTAKKVAAWLEKHECVLRVVHPGLPSYPQKELAEKQLVDWDGDLAPGSMIFFELDSAKIDAEQFVDEIARSAYSVTLAVSLGHTKTLIELPSSMTHSSYGKPGGMGLRLSIGLESPTDVIEDLKNAMNAVTKTSSRNARGRFPGGLGGEEEQERCEDPGSGSVFEVEEMAHGANASCVSYFFGSGVL